MKHTRTNLLLLLSSLIALGFTGAAWAGAPVTRALHQMIAVPAGGSVKVENLVGHMTVTQGSGPLQVTATVVAAGSQAQALADSIKLDVSTAGKQVTVHVHYPVNQYSTYLYNPPHTNADGDENYCFLGFICVHGNGHSDVDYQGTRVQVNENGDSGAPLYVDVS
ncbi:MAG: hypothetical protein ACRESX_07565, partial [Gammaproteobacteria bacterium]